MPTIGVEPLECKIFVEVVSQENPELEGNLPKAETPLLSDPNEAVTQEDGVVCAAANAAINEEVRKAAAERGVKCRQKP